MIFTGQVSGLNRMGPPFFASASAPLTNEGAAAKAKPKPVSPRSPTKWVGSRVTGGFQMHFFLGNLIRSVGNTGLFCNKMIPKHLCWCSWNPRGWIGNSQARLRMPGSLPSFCTRTKPVQNPIFTASPETSWWFDFERQDTLILPRFFSISIGSKLFPQKNGQSFCSTIFLFGPCRVWKGHPHKKQNKPKWLTVVSENLVGGFNPFENGWRFNLGIFSASVLGIFSAFLRLQQ